MNDILEKYKNSREKINSELVNQLRNNTTDLSDNPAIPQKDAFGNPINFLEMVAYKRFLEVVERVKRNTGIQDISGQSGFMQLQGILSESAYKIFGVEATQINYLEKLAVDLVIEEMKIPNGAFQFDCKIVSLGKVSKQGFQDEAQNPSENEIEKTFGEQSSANDMTPNELFELEKHKRRFINLLIQGASKKGHYMYLLVQDKLNNINPELSSLYGKMMSINDLTYWILPDSMIKMIASNSSSMAGKEEIDDTTNPPTIKTQAICFPVSIHEIIKGIMEVFGTQGLPDEPNMAQMIIDSVDSLANETTDLRLGVGIWEIFYNCYPAFVFEDEYKHIQHYMFARFCALEIEEFFKVSRMILSDETRGKKYMLDLANEIVSDLKNREYNDTFENDDDMTFNNGGTADDMTMIGRAIEYLTGTAIERDSIVDKGFKYEFRYKGKSVVTSIDSKLVRDTIYSQRKSLAGRYEKGGVIEVVGKGSKGAFRKREYQGMTEKEVADWWIERGYTMSKSKSESKLKPFTFYIEKYENGGGIEDVIVYDNGGESFDRYTIFTPDGSVYGMSYDASGFNQYLGDDTEVEKGSHLGKKLKSVPKSIEKAVMQRMNDSYSVGGGVEGNKRDKYNKLIGRRDNEFYFLDDIFHYEDGFKGATGSVVVPVNKTYYDYATSYDGILERYMDAMGEDEWLDTLGYQREDFEDEDEMISAIEDGIWQTYLNGGLEPFEEVSYDLEEQMRNLPEFSDSDEFPLFEIIGGGRVFDKDRKFDEIYDQELYNKIREVEEFKRGGGVYNRSWHQDHSRHNKRENYEVPMSSRKKAHGGTIEERMRMRRGM